LKHSKDARLAPEWKRYDTSATDLLRRFGNSSTINPDMALIDNGLSDASAFDQANAVQIAVDPQGAFRSA
jgi:hypothetical protein